MKTININDFEEKIYYEKLKSSFEVFLVPLKDKKDYFVSMGIKYGNSNTSFKVNDKDYNVPSGIAHFLEHKLFERNEELKPFEFFAKSGTDVNASTSISWTQYYCAGNNDFTNNLKYFLKWLTKLEIDDSLVEKEKGIILQEANMHSDNPDRFIYEKIRKNTFVNDSYGKKVIGEDIDIQSITKEDLELCFKSFYRPDNMFLVITGLFDVDETLKVIKESLKDFKNPKEKVIKNIIDEPKNVLVKEEIFNKDIPTPKVAISYKMKTDTFKMDKYKLNIYLSMILSLGFGNTSVYKEEALKNNIFLSLNTSVNESDSYEMILFESITNSPDKLIKSVEETFKNIKIEEQDFSRIRKAWIAGEIKYIDNVAAINQDIFSDVIDYNEYKNNKISDLRNLTYKDLNNIIKKLDFNHKAVIKLLPLK